MAEFSDRKFNFKVVLLGDGCVGKTSLVLRYVENKFNDKHTTTLQASYLNKKLNVDGKKINLSIWDTAGQERFHALGPIYYRDSNGAILVYDISDEDSFEKVKSWVKELRRMLGQDVTLSIVGNKTDLGTDRHVTVQDAEAYASSVNAFHHQSSAKLNRGIEEIFLHLCKGMIDKSESKAANSSPSWSAQSSVVVVDDQQREAGKQTSSCCRS